jgi:hypothetical protein
LKLIKSYKLPENYLVENSKGEFKHGSLTHYHMKTLGGEKILGQLKTLKFLIDK